MVIATQQKQNLLKNMKNFAIDAQRVNFVTLIKNIIFIMLLDGSMCYISILIMIYHIFLCEFSHLCNHDITCGFGQLKQLNLGLENPFSKMCRLTKENGVGLPLILTRGSYKKSQVYSKSI